MILSISIGTVVDSYIMYNWDFYDSLPDFHPIADANNLYDGYRKARKGSHWKGEVQRFRWDKGSKIAELQSDLMTYWKTGKGYNLEEYSRFEVNERGCIRPITALRIRDRVVKHALNDLYLIPHIRPHLIYDNGASLKGKGVDFTRRRLIAHLERYYKKYGTNEGYIRLTDFSGFYDNIDHELAYLMICYYEPDKFARLLVKQALDSYRIDVSFLSPDDYQLALNSKFRLTEYRKEHPGEHRELRFLNRSLSVGDQTSQITAIAFPTPIDNLMKIVCGQKYYARYMDDTYLISHSIIELKAVGKQFDKCARDYRLFVNERKTQICKISKPFTFLQFRYYLKDNGHVVVRINKKTVTRMRRKLKKLHKRILQGKTSFHKAEEVFRSWICSYKHVMSKQQVRNIVSLYQNLYGGGLDQWLIMKRII